MQQYAFERAEGFLISFYQQVSILLPKLLCEFSYVLFYFLNHWLHIFPNQDAGYESNLLDTIVIEQGNLIRTKHLVPPGAATNFAKLIVDAHGLSLKAIHSQQTCFGLVYKLCILQQVIWNDRYSDLD